MEPIGYEFDAAWGRSKASEIVLPSLDLKRELPCDACPAASTCASEGTECSAFRNWASTGNFKDSDVQRFIRRMK